MATKRVALIRLMTFGILTAMQSLMLACGLNQQTQLKTKEAGVKELRNLDSLFTLITRLNEEDLYEKIKDIPLHHKKGADFIAQFSDEKKIFGGVDFAGVQSIVRRYQSIFEAEEARFATIGEAFKSNHLNSSTRPMKSKQQLYIGLRMVQHAIRTLQRSPSILMLDDASYGPPSVPDDQKENCDPTNPYCNYLADKSVVVDPHIVDELLHGQTIQNCNDPWTEGWFIVCVQEMVTDVKKAEDSIKKAGKSIDDQTIDSFMTDRNNPSSCIHTVDVLTGVVNFAVNDNTCLLSTVYCSQDTLRGEELCKLAGKAMKAQRHGTWVGKKNEFK